MLLRLTPRTLFLMPTLAIITGATGWYLAEDLGFTALSWPQYGWVVEARPRAGLGLHGHHTRICFSRGATRARSHLLQSPQGKRFRRCAA